MLQRFLQKDLNVQCVVADPHQGPTRYFGVGPVGEVAGLKRHAVRRSMEGPNLTNEPDLYRQNLIEVAHTLSPES